MCEKQKLLKWLKDRYCDVEAEKVEAINTNDDIANQLYAIFGIEPDEDAEPVDMWFIERRMEKRAELLQLGATKELLDNIDHVALNQADLIDCLNRKRKTIYFRVKGTS